MIQFDAREMLDAVKFAAKSVPIKPIMPILGNVYFRCEQQDVLATNLEVFRRADLPIEIESDMLLPAALLVKGLEKMEGEVTMKQEGDNYVFRSGRRRFTLQSPDDPKDYPQVIGANGQTDKELVATWEGIDKGVMRGLIGATERDGTLYPERTFLCLCCHGGEDVVVGLDGKLFLRYAAPGLTLERGDEALVHAAIIDLCGEDEVLIEAAGSQMVASTGTRSVGWAAAAGRYPNWAQFFISSAFDSQRCDADELLAAVVFVSPFATHAYADGNQKEVILSFSDEGLRVSSRDGRAECQIKYEGNPSAARICVQGKYLRDALGASSGEVEVIIEDSAKPLLIRDKRLWSIIAPLTIPELQAH